LSYRVKRHTPERAANSILADGNAQTKLVIFGDITECRIANGTERSILCPAKAWIGQRSTHSCTTCERSEQEEAASWTYENT